jgi:hypothetical protein
LLLPRLVSDCNPPVSASGVAWITGVRQHRFDHLSHAPRDDKSWFIFVPPDRQPVLSSRVEFELTFSNLLSGHKARLLNSGNREAEDKESGG